MALKGVRNDAGSSKRVRSCPRLGPGRHCSPRHMEPFKSRDEDPGALDDVKAWRILLATSWGAVCLKIRGFKVRWMTRPVGYGLPRHRVTLTPVTRVQSAVDDNAGSSKRVRSCPSVMRDITASAQGRALVDFLAQPKPFWSVSRWCSFCDELL